MTSTFLRRIFSFVGVGAFASLCYAAIAFVCVYVFDIQEALSSALAYTCCIPISFLGQKNITFGDRKTGRHKFKKFVLMQMCLGLVAVLVTWVVSLYLPDHAYIGIIAVCIVIPGSSYLIMSKSIFPRK